MSVTWKRLLLACAVSLLLGPHVMAQGTATTTLSGVVVDPAGGVIPGASVSVKSNATATTFETVTNGEGAFAVPALSAGTYTVTVSLMGFKTAVLGDVQLLPGRPTDIRAVLDVGSLSETVVVEGASP